MELSKKEIDFEFPFEPYDIQKSFMSTLYETLQNDKIGIFESPTGTGKSLSLICGSLRWLFDYEIEKEEKIKSIINFSSAVERTNDDKANDEEKKEPSWVTDFFKQKAANVQLEKLKEKESLKKKKNELIEKRKNIVNFKRKRENCPSLENELNNNLTSSFKEIISDEDNKEDDEELILDYCSDEDTVDLISDEEQDNIEEEYCTKIFYCSRTHSQLSQFVHEVQKSPYANRVKLVVLGSRQNYCINEKVNQQKNVYQINEKCLDLQKKKKERKKDINQPKKKRKKEETSNGCPYYSSKKVHDFKDYVTMEVQDIEQIVKLGKDLNTCPYYGTRHTIPKAQLVVLPYQTLLHRGTRESVGINVKDCVVIIDEAHNLIETINNIHSVEIRQNQITSSINQLKHYKDKYFKRLKAINLMYIEQIIFVFNSLLKVLKEHIESPTEEYLSTINDFIYSAKIDNVNLFKIHKYCEQSSIAKKLNGFIEKYQTEYVTTHSEENVEVLQTSQFMYAESFLYALTNSDKDGRILVTKSKVPNKSSIKFLMLNPAVHFIDIIKDCKSLILAGGTMAPVGEIKDLLFYTSGIPSSRITEFSCGHVIPSSNLLVLALQKGPSSMDMSFTYQSRNNFDLVDELGRLLVNICSVVPGGIVCFFPSYDYEEFVYKRWINTSLFNKIDSKKKVFREPKSAMLCDQVLSEYTNMIKKSQSSGAVLLSVVGGKMSEGINFSDDLGRCIVMIGLPYPNVNSPELKEKMQFLNRTINPTAGKEHLENICMKAVNQSIGRSIRHKNDYASIILIDQRYSRSSVINKLPSWINSQLQTHQRFGPALASISKFFAGKRIAL
ncbi:ATP-dependent DNA helicase DDX11 isoform X1 [Hydra vulgaris]|uniref:ATP-dependent DNA helicase DDX11 isoform X1 n=1 Tax=Hydra vulgaris TaxID=6087 RepID=UPI001F5F2EF2|nr:ATP-dependent DNA helicase DDX11 isoform X1 [Hydra vulgaris]